MPLLGSLPWPLAAQAAEQAASTLAGRISATQDPEQLYALALAALAADQPRLASQALERVVALQPRFAGAWLDLALATYRSGDPAAALEHLEYLRGQFSVPPALAAQMDYWQSIWQNAPQAAEPPGWQGEVLFGFGRDSNANTGLAHPQITLSLPTGRALFEVDKAYRPHPDRYGLLSLTLGGPAQALGAGRISPVLLLRGKQLAREGGFSSLDLQSGLLYQRAAAGQGQAAGRWQAHLLARHYRLGGQTLFGGLRLAAQRSQPWHGCQASGGAEVETRWHQRVPSLGGALYSASASLGCRLPGNGSLSATVKAGFEQARQGRPGGDNHSTELTVRYEQPLSASQSLQASWQTGRTADRHGYSPLLEDNAIRRVRRQALSLGLRQAITRQWDARLSYEYSWQRANLPLFEQQGSAFQFGLAYQFD